VQSLQSVPATYCPYSQVVHDVPEPSELKPGGHVWHVESVPSTKYWPAPQQTPAPEGVQCLKKPELQVAVQAVKVLLGA
jgi:hypothetical protein